MGDSIRDAIEQDLARAQQLGRWLSDDELQAAERAEQDALALKQQEDSRRTRLMVLTVVCVLIPPLWPLALALTLYLLFPRSTSRVLMATGVGAIVLVLGLIGASAALVVWLWMLLF